ncbi:MAG: hypothetical protein V1850_07655 [Candidatus Bathyarchaeota archaeon]
MAERISAHESVRDMYGKIKADGLTNIWGRWDAQEKVRCKNFYMKGLSCQFCSNGPCGTIPGKERIYSLNTETMEKMFEAVENHAQKFCPAKGKCVHSR